MNVAQGHAPLCHQTRLRGETVGTNAPRSWRGKPTPSASKRPRSLPGAAPTLWRWSSCPRALAARRGWQPYRRRCRSRQRRRRAVRWSAITIDATGTADAPLVKGEIGPFNAVAVARRLGRDDIFGDLQLGGSFTLRSAGTRSRPAAGSGKRRYPQCRRQRIDSARSERDDRKRRPGARALAPQLSAGGSSGRPRPDQRRGGRAAVNRLRPTWILR